MAKCTRAGRAAAALAVVAAAVAICAAGPAAADKPPKLTSGMVKELRGLVKNVYEPSEWSKVINESSWNTAWRGVAPELLVRPGDEAEVVATLAWANKEKQPVTVRASGHSAAGWGVRAGAVLVDISLLRDINVTAAGAANVGGAALMGDVLQAAEDAAVVFPSASAASVSMGGYLQGGGIGLGARSLGLGCDLVRGFRMVLANGSGIVSASATERPDLFSAVLGGGGGNFGVVTQYRLVAAVDEVSPTWSTFAVVAGPGGGAAAQAAMREAYFNFTDGAAAAADMYYDRDAGGAAVTGLWDGATADDAHAFLDSFPDVLPGGVNVTKSYAANMTYAEAASKMRESAKPSGSLVKSRFLAGRPSDELVRVADSFADANSKYGGHWFVQRLGGKIEQPSAGSGAGFPHRGQKYLMVVKVGGDKVAAARDELEDALETADKTLESETTGLAYVNYPDPRLPSGAGPEMYYGKAAYKELVAVKKEYDPDYILGYPSSIRTCPTCYVRGYTPPPTKEGPNYPALYAIIALAVIATVLLVYVVFRKDKPVQQSNEPLLS